MVADNHSLYCNVEQGLKIIMVSPNISVKSLEIAHGTSS